MDGTPITAAHLRELLAQLGALGVQAPAGGSLGVALTDDDGALLATVTAASWPGSPPAAAAPTAGTPTARARCSAPRPRSTGYHHTAAQERFLRLRDRTCRHPGCGQPAGRTDADHVVPYDCGGRTGCENLCCLCRSHHRLKTFARGWRFAMLPDGTLPSPPRPASPAPPDHQDRGQGNDLTGAVPATCPSSAPSPHQHLHRSTTLHRPSSQSRASGSATLQPTAPIFAACAAGTTGSRPTPAVGVTR